MKNIKNLHKYTVVCVGNEVFAKEVFEKDLETPKRDKEDDERI